MNKKYWMCVLAAVAVGGTTVQAQQYNSEPVMNEIAAIRQAVSYTHLTLPTNSRV